MKQSMGLRLTIWLLWCGALAVILYPALAPARNYYTPVPIATDCPSPPQINDDGQVVWEAVYDDTHNFDIHLYDPSVDAYTNISDRPSLPGELNWHDNNPQINNNSQVVWQAHYSDLSTSEIFLNKDNISESPGFKDELPQINDNGEVVWRRLEPGSPDSADDDYYEIYYWSTSTGPIPIGDKTGKESSFPRINDNGQIVWQGWDHSPDGAPWEGDYEIYLYDASWAQGTKPQKITNNDDVWDVTPQINNDGWIVWQADGEIYLETDYTDANPPALISDISSAGEHPQISDNGWVTWEGFGGDIWLWESPTKQTNLGPGSWPQINDNGWVVWVRMLDGDNWEIWEYDSVGGPDPTKISDDSGGVCEAPKINDDGWVVYLKDKSEIYLTKPINNIWLTVDLSGFQVSPQWREELGIVWQGWDGHDYEIYFQDPGQDLIQLTDNDSQDAMPQMNASGDLVWMNWDGNDWEIWYDKGQGPEALTQNSGFDVLPQITDDGLIYWQAWDGHDYEIYMRDINSPSTVPSYVTKNDRQDVAPQVNSSGELTWMAWDGHDFEIMIEDSPWQITDNSGQDILPTITPEGQVYWQGWDGSDYEVYRYTIASGITENLTENTVDDYSPAVNNGHLVWSQWDGHDLEIYYLALHYDATTQITDDVYNDYKPQVNSSGEIVWMKWVENPDVFDGYYTIYAAY